MPDFRRLLGRLVPNMGDLLTRFPVPVLIGALTSLYLILTTHRTLFTDSASPYLVMTLSAGFFWSLAAALFAQSRGWSGIVGHLVGIAGAALIVVLGAYPLATEISLPNLIVAMMLGVSIAGYVGMSANNATFWQFNHNLWLGAAIGLLAALLFYAGIASILGTLKYLFRISFDRHIWSDTAAIAFGLIGPIAWLGLIPRRFDDPVIEGPQSDFTSYAVAALVKFLLVPMLLVYTVILHAYAIKIGLEAALPKGRLGWMVLSYGGVLTLTALLTYPTRESGGFLVRLFWRFWPVLLIVPTFLLFVAITQRIGQYGFTEKRYFVVMAGVWLVALAAIFGLFPKRRDLRLIPATLGILALVSAFGPWGMSGLSARSQISAFTSILDKAGVTSNGKLTAKRDAASPIADDDAKRLVTILTYLRRNAHLDLLAPIFAGKPDDPFSVATNERSGKTPATNASQRHNWYPKRSRYTVDKSLAENVRKRLAIKSTGYNGMQRRYFGANSKTAVRLEGVGWITGNIYLNHANQRAGHTDRTKPFIVSLGDDQIDVKLDGKVVVVTHVKSQRSATFDLTANKMLTATKPRSIKRVRANDRDAKRARVMKKAERPPVIIDRKAGSLDARLVVLNANGIAQDDGSIEWNSVSIYLVITDPSL